MGDSSVHATHNVPSEDRPVARQQRSEREKPDGVDLRGIDKHTGWGKG
jgi:hypothetical protein